MNERTPRRYPAGRISDIRATTVTVPLEAPLRHANGAHWGRFVRTIVQVFTDEGLAGLGEIGGRGGYAGPPTPEAKPQLPCRRPPPGGPLRRGIRYPPATPSTKPPQHFAA